MLIFKTNYSQNQWEVTFGGSNYLHSDVSFINPNVGFATGLINSVIRVSKTTNKGLNWSLILTLSGDYNFSKNSSIYFLSETIGYISYLDKIVKYSNGAVSTVFTFPTISRWHRIKFVNNLVGYALFSRIPTEPLNQTDVSIYKTTNGGDSWFITSASNIILQYGSNRNSELRDIDFSSSHPDTLVAVGSYINGTGSIGNSFDISTTNGFASRTVGSDGVSGSKFGHVVISNDNEIRILGNKGLTIHNIGGTSYTSRYNFGNASDVPELGMKFINDEIGYVSLKSGSIMKTTNGGYNWNFEVNIGPSSDPLLSSRIINFGEIIYYGDATNKNFYTRKLSTNFNTYFDNESTTSSFFFDGTEYTSPNTQYLRGGYSHLSCLNILNTGQSNERIFYKWSDGKMQSDNQNYYFDMSGTTIANYYKTKQFSTTSTAISNSGQSKIIKDGLGALNQIHQSMDGGIFYTKSYNNGSSYKSEEVVNNTAGHSIADGNKNPSLVETRLYSATSGGYPVNKNITVCWERFNSASGNTEIKAAVRNYNIFSDTSFFWQSWEDVNYSDVFTEFTSSAGYNSNPKIFAIAMDPVNNLGNPSTYFLIIPHLRPSSNGNKIQVTCRKGNLYQEFALDSGDISDLSVTDSTNYFGSLPIYFTYRKDNQIIYRKIKFVFDWDLYISNFQ